MTFADDFNMACSLKHDLDKLLCNHIPRSMINDSQSLFDVLSKATCTTKRRITIDFRTVKDAFKWFGANDVVLVRSDHKIADAFT